MAGNTAGKCESAVTQLLTMRMASPKQLAAAEKRDADHEISKAHLAELHATEDQARKEGGFAWAVHDLMTEEVEKYVRAYSRDEKRAWYEIDKLWVEKLQRTSSHSTPLERRSGESGFST